MICLYSIDYYNGEKTVTTYGILKADSYVDAMRQLEDFLYGSDLIKINSMELFDAIPEFSKEIFDQLTIQYSTN